MASYLSQGYLDVSESNEPDWNSISAFWFLIANRYSLHHITHIINRTIGYRYILKKLMDFINNQTLFTLTVNIRFSSYRFWVDIIVFLNTVIQRLPACVFERLKKANMPFDRIRTCIPLLYFLYFDTRFPRPVDVDYYPLSGLYKC